MPKERCPNCGSGSFGLHAKGYCGRCRFPYGPDDQDEMGIGLLKMIGFIIVVIGGLGYFISLNAARHSSKPIPAPAGDYDPSSH
jgi:hypothetical protein